YYIFGREGASRLADELKAPLLAQIPVVGNICEHGDEGQPIALEDSVTGHAFMHLAHEVTEAVDRRNNQLPPTVKVNVTRK
ncbi:MAG: Mrp/NBP35 family ATP-binding protein, partial [Muribaculaceae bacterium]|nr:Mrp/NBP35 family ATP-binding protein [Muribaculaceae bacterium]